MKLRRGILITGTRLEIAITTTKHSVGGHSNNRRVGVYFRESEVKTNTLRVKITHSNSNVNRQGARRVVRSRPARALRYRPRHGDRPDYRVVFVRMRS
jgi:hypothetical protein